MRIVGVVLSMLAAVAMLSGCSAQQTEEQAAQEENQAYMSQVNETMESLEVKLASFVDAVSRGDVVSMRTQAEGAYAVLDDLAAIEAPEALKDIHSSYVDGVNELEAALTSYVDLYTEIDSATESNLFDWGTYDDRLADIKAHYDKGIELLQEGDSAAADKK